jgi:ACS family hexuronate transporter-like MFS transporter
MPTDTSPAGASPGAPPKPRGRYRWRICALLFFATTINYIDRQVLGILKPVLAKDLGWTEIDYSNIVAAFQVAYAAGYLFAGRFVDRVGVRTGYAVIVAFWSLFACAHGLVALVPVDAAMPITGDTLFGRGLRLWLYGAGVTTALALPWTVVGFCMARFALGLTEGGNFPAAIKAVSEWHPVKERAFSTGIFNAGSNVGALLTPLIVPVITLSFGWSVSFYVTGSLGFIWLAFWLRTYRPLVSHPRVTAEERAYILSDPPDPEVKVSWLGLLGHRQTWAFVVGMFMAAPIWWFYLNWIPGFLYEKHGLNLLQMGVPLVTIYLVADVGSIGGGWLSSRLIARGWSVNAARKISMLVCALCVVPVFLAANTKSLTLATLLISLAAAAHQGFAANLFTLVSDTAPRFSVSSIVGIGGMAGSIGGVLLAKATGFILETTGNYLILFGIASGAYLVALAVIHLLNPRLAPMDLGPAVRRAG